MTAWRSSGSSSGALSFSPLTYTYTGTLTVEPSIVLAPPQPLQINGGITTYAGKWASSVTLGVSNTSLTGIDFDDLEGTTTSFGLTLQASVTSLGLPLLKQVGGTLNLSCGGLTSLTAPELVYVGSSFSAGTGGSITVFSFPKLVGVNGTFSPTTMAALTEIEMPLLEFIGGVSNAAIAPTAMAALTSFSLPSIVRIGPQNTSGSSIAFTSGTAALTTFTLGSTLKQVGGTAGNVVISSAALTEASVDNILVRLAALDGTNGTTTFDNRTVTITGTSAAPSATGLAAKDTLVARGCTVTHN